MIHAKVIVMKISKCKKELARIISDNGGWPERALWAVQDNCIAFFLGGRPEYKSGDRCWYSNCLDGACVGTITRDEKVTNWHQTILSREEYFHLYPSPDADGWVECGGGECPVGEDDRIDVKFSDGDTLFDVDSNWDWSGDVDMCNIIAYRLHKTEQAKPEFCESVMRTIPEPEAKPTIDQLAADYRNAKECADRKQEEADAAKADADAKLADLVAAGKALGLALSVADPEPWLVITDWRDLRVGDEVEIVESFSEERVGHIGVITRFSETDEKFRVRVHFNGNEQDYEWISKWCFIRRP